MLHCFCRINKSACISFHFSFQIKMQIMDFLKSATPPRLRHVVNYSAYVKCRAQLLIGAKQTKTYQQMHGNKDTINLQVMAAICMNEMTYNFACTARVVCEGCNLMGMFVPGYICGDASPSPRQG